MAENRSNLTPEKQLLKLIEEPQTAGAKGPARGVKMSALSLGALQGRIGFLKQSVVGMAKGWSAGARGPLDIKKINILLTSLAAVIGIYFVVICVILTTRFSTPPAFSFKPEPGDKGAVGKYTSQLKALTFYKEKISARDLFQLGPRKEAAAEAAVPDKTAQEADAVLGKYKLVGISWSDNPDAMIESSADQKTTFIKRGQMVEGVKVEAIYKDKVVLSYNGREAELR
jgi:hypothetical protein